MLGNLGGIPLYDIDSFAMNNIELRKWYGMTYSSGTHNGAVAPLQAQGECKATQATQSIEHGEISIQDVFQ